MANVGKKVSLFSLLSFCFVKLDLRVWEDSWEKVVEKWMISWIRLETCLCLKRWYCQGNWQQKSEERILASFSSYNMLSFYPTFFFATISQIDVKNEEIWWIFMHRENAEFWFTKFQNAWIHSLKRSTFKSWSAFLVSEKCVLRIWLWKNAGRGVYATPKFWHKIQDSKKTVDYLLNRSRRRLKKSFLRL